MHATASWRGWDHGPYAAVVHSLRDFTPADAQGVCLGIARGKSGGSAGIAEIVTGPAVLTSAGVPPFVEAARRKDASEIHVIAASSPSQAAAIVADLKPE